MLNLDTHIVVKLLQGDLGVAEKTAISYEPLSISSIVIWEVAKLHQLGRISFGVDHPAFARFLARTHIWPIDAAVAAASTRLDFRSDPADEIIAATSCVHRVPLVTRDERLLASRLVPIAR